MKKLVLVKSIFVIFFLTKITACDNLAAGSYPYAETYELNYSEEEVKIAITQFKKINTEYIVPKVTIDGKTTWDLDDHKTNPPHFYIIYFYYPKENQIVYAWTRPAEKGKTTFAFVSINEGLTIGNWKEINKDFDSEKNKIEKKKFEERILNQIKKILNSKLVSKF